MGGGRYHKRWQPISVKVKCERISMPTKDGAQVTHRRRRGGAARKRDLGFVGQNQNGFSF